MHRKILEEASHEQLKHFIDRTFRELKDTDYEMYEELEEELYEDVYGCHFTEWLLDCATHKMHNEDGTMGAHWTVEQTTEVAKREGIVNRFGKCFLFVQKKGWERLTPRNFCDKIQSWGFPCKISICKG